MVAHARDRPRAGGPGRQEAVMMVLARLLAVWIAACVLAGAASGQTQWDMPTPYPEGNFHTRNVARFAADVDRGTGGSLKIQLHPAGSLLAHSEIKRAVRQGTAPIGEMLISLAANEAPVYGLDSVPFLATGYDAARKLYAAQRPYLEKRLAAEGLLLLYSVPWPPQGLYSKREIRSVEELRGLKFRSYNIMTGRVAALAGAIPTEIEVSDLPTAFATGRIDVMITSASTGVDSKAQDYLTHYTDAQAWLPRNVVIVNKAAFDKLSSAQRTALTAAAKAAEERGWNASMEETVAKTQALQAVGITVHAPSESLKAGLTRIGEQMADEWAAAAGPEGKAILDAFRK
jgi:TRAP-type C4-dicarboxylate transport system substrate-binding protein